MRVCGTKTVDINPSNPMVLKLKCPRCCVPPLVHQVFGASPKLAQLNGFINFGVGPEP